MEKFMEEIYEKVRDSANECIDINIRDIPFSTNYFIQVAKKCPYKFCVSHKKDIVSLWI